MKKLIAHLRQALTDSHAILVGISTAVLAGIHDFVATADIDAIALWDKRKWILHGLKVVGAPVVAWLIAARPHQDAQTIIGKLIAAGYSVPPAAPPPQVPPAL